MLAGTGVGREGNAVIVGVMCASCGPLMVDAAAVQVHRNPRTGFALYTFTCPRCGSDEAHDCRDTVASLVARGVVAYELRSTTDPAFTMNDVAALHAWLETDPVWTEPST